MPVTFLRPIRIADGLYQIRAIGARVTVLVDKDAVLLVDAGSLGSAGLIVRGLGALGLSAGHLERVVVTHAHPDHCGGLSGLIKGRAIAVAAHTLDADFIDGTATPPSPVQNVILGRLTHPVYNALMGRPVPVADRLEDGDLVDFGLEVRVVHLPGHTDGSIALYIPAKRAVIVGDTLQYRFARNLGPPARWVTRRPDMAIRSLEKLLNLDFDVICFSHFPPLREEPHKAIRRLIDQHSLRPSPT